MSKGPYVSFVTYGRNDGYTPSYARRVSRATACLASQLERAGIDSEIVFMEWNPPADKTLMLDLFEFPAHFRHVTVRGYVVPEHYHQGFAGAGEAGFHAGEAANSGIRRARGRFITPKASDSFLSPDVFKMIARADLDADTMYRIDRHDIAITDEAIWNLDDDALLAKLGSLPSHPHAWIQCQSRHWGLRELHTNACGDFTLMTSAYWHHLRGHVRDASVLSLDIDSLVMHAAAALGVQRMSLAGRLPRLQAAPTTRSAAQRRRSSNGARGSACSTNSCRRKSARKQHSGRAPPSTTRVARCVASLR